MYLEPKALFLCYNMYGDNMEEFDINSLVNDIKDSTYNGIKNIIIANKEYNKSKRVIILNNIDNNLKFLKVLIRISYKQRYISSKNYSSWSKKITNIYDL